MMANFEMAITKLLTNLGFNVVITEGVGDYGQGTHTTYEVKKGNELQFKYVHYNTIKYLGIAPVGIGDRNILNPEIGGFEYIGVAVHKGAHYVGYSNFDDGWYYYNDIGHQVEKDNDLHHINDSNEIIVFYIRY